MHTNLLNEIWGEDFVRSTVWEISTDTTSTDYENLRPPKRFGFYEYLKMLIKLLPPGLIWEIPFGSESDY